MEQNKPINTEDTASTEAKEKNTEKKSTWEDALLRIFLIAAPCIILFNLFVAQLARVDGASMSPTMEDNQLLLVSKIEKTYNRGDIIIFRMHNSFLVKRIVALPGETVSIEDNRLFVNGEPLDDYVSVDVEDWGMLAEGITLTDEQFIVLGDNRNHSADSRDFGPIDKSDIKSKVIIRFYPFTTY